MQLQLLMPKQFFVHEVKVMKFYPVWFLLLISRLNRKRAAHLPDPEVDRLTLRLFQLYLHFLLP